jgi:hypothetical protein
MSAPIDLMKKLAALAERGEGGEKQTARQMLDGLLKKHGMTEEDLNAEKVDMHVCWLNGDEEVRMFAQVASSTLKGGLKMYGEFDKKTIKEFKSFGMHGNYGISCTNAQFIEIMAKHEFFYRVYQEERKVFFRAFCTKNNLLSPMSDPNRKPTKEEMEEHYKAERMSAGMDRHSYHKQLTD